MKKSNYKSDETNVIIYCRVSTDEQRQGTSVDVQEERLKAYCTYKGYNIINIACITGRLSNVLALSSSLQS